MKVRKYGGFEVSKGSELHFAIVIQMISEDDEVVYRFVTDVEMKSKRWMMENKKEAYLFEDRHIAQEICACMILNGTSAFVVECLGKNKLKNWF